MISRSTQEIHGLTALPFSVFLLLTRRVQLGATTKQMILEIFFVFRSVHVPANQKRPTRRSVTLNGRCFH